MEASSGKETSKDGSNLDATRYVSRILKGSGSMFSGSLIEKVISFVLNLVLTRGLGATLYGLYTLGITILRLIQGTASLGLQNGIVRFAAPPYERKEYEVVKGTFLAGAGIGLTTGLVSALILHWTAPWLASTVFGKPELVEVIEVFAYGLPFFVFTFLASRMARALGQIQVDVLLSAILQPAIFLLLVGGLFVANFGFTATLYAFVASTIVAAVTSVYAVYHLFPPIISALDAHVNLRALLRFSIPIVGINLASVGLTYTDRLMLGAFSSSEAVGIYTAAASMAVQLKFVLSAINTPFSPMIADLYQNDRLDTLRTLYTDTVRWIIVFTLPAALIFLTYAPLIMSIYGPEFRQGGHLLRILAVAYLVVAGVGSVGHILQMSDNQDFVLGINTFMALLNIGLNWILIQWYDATGAAIATGITQALGNVIQIAALYHFLKLQPFRRDLWKPVAAILLTGLPAWTLHAFVPSPFRWLIGIPLILVIYAALLLAFGLHRRDRSIASALWTRFTTSESP